MLNPSKFLHLLSITSIPDLTSETNEYREAGVVSMELDTFDHKCYVTYDPPRYGKEHSSFIFIFVYTVYDNTTLDDVCIDTYEICDNIITDDNNNSFDMSLYNTEESLFQLSTVIDAPSLEDIKQFQEHLDAVREMFYNHYPEVEFN